MDVVDHGGDAAGPLFRVGDEVAGFIALFCGPAVVNVDVCVAEVLEAELDELVGRVQGVFLGRGIALRDVLV